MKVRNGFVSNSSSSSFLVISKKDSPEIDIPKNMIHNVNYYGNTRQVITIPSKLGKFDFGWETERCYEFIGKLNYVAIQALELPNNEEKYKAKEVIENALNRKIEDLVIEWDYNSIEWDSPDNFAYIDHQSCTREYRSIENCYECNRAFESVDSMYNFLFNLNSYVQGGNDNTGWEEGDEYWESLKEAYGKVYFKHYENYYNKQLCEGTCRLNPGRKLIYTKAWYDKQGNDLETIEERNKYFNTTEGSPYFDGYYFCSNPCDKEDCPFRNFYGLRDEAIIADKYINEYMNWNEDLK